MTASKFQTVYAQPTEQEAFHRYLQNNHYLYPADRLHHLIREVCAQQTEDAVIYEEVQRKLPSIKPFLGSLFYSWPSLIKQKKALGRQTYQLLGKRPKFDGYAEIGSTGRYLSGLRNFFYFLEPLIWLNEIAPSNSLANMMERGEVPQLGTFVPLNGYAPIDPTAVPSESVGLVTCYPGLHGVEPGTLDSFLDSIRRILRPEGLFILREFDVTTPELADFVALTKTISDLTLGVPWAVHREKRSFFASVKDWSLRLQKNGFQDNGKRVRQTNDPSVNTLMFFTKPA